MVHPLQDMYDTHLRMWHGLSTIGNGVSVKSSSVHPTAGLGLFAHNRSFAKGEYVTGYHGVLIDRKTAKALRLAGRDTHIRTVNHELHVDGAATPNKRGLPAGSFANDGTPCGIHNNARIQSMYTTDGLMCLPVVVATRDIQADEEILVSYGSSYWRVHQRS